MSISVTVRLSDSVEVDVSTDASWSPDVMDSMLAHAREAAVAAWTALDEVQAEDER